MGHTNSTTNYNLPQFLPTDKPAWLTDINGAFTAIDTGMKNAKDAGDNAQSTANDAAAAAAAAASTASGADAKGSGAVNSTADIFDPNATYAVGAIVMYNNLLYKCTVAVTTPGAWTGSANWERTTINALITALKSQLIQYEYEEGASGVWTWRKYNDGTIELWGEEESTFSSTFSAWGSIYSLDVAGLGAYPITFTRIDEMHGACGLARVNSVSSIVNFSATANITTAPSYMMIRGTNIGAEDRTLYKTLYVKGTWY